MTWITWFCSLLGNEYFCEVAPEYIEDDFNIYGLHQIVPYYEDALSTILDQEPPDEHDRSLDNSAVESSAEVLYGLIHQRYINTRAGMNDMANKFAAGHFGHCPRVYCESTPVLPVGRSDIAGLETVKLFCPSCLDLYSPASSRYQGIDGAFFGTTFPHLFMESFPDLIRGHTPPRPLNMYAERIFGFKVSEKSHSGPRMKWLRSFPDSDIESEEELDSEDLEMDIDLEENGQINPNLGDSSEMAVSSNTISQPANTL
ncbi:hypothetical protein CONCODRAFT_46805 [Conidiobolus coronatus NRRL 28638]|uniref:Casein kinase II subunit beta n=1 Tax=Conidiobolus coronatus (strain ATCC 28846 / CBS 209.66 / NRRL 28638) TaxID=796925 RepID=A0A137PEK0_CONC2|nr:hypothetical protein CONCODRAFT_46805 [Conidiobolus coronatus NRRL 28638]|eukprot:KXN73423.1 hypothetical protein CONCODRAFT_46805 [Conidiobolus coronatus NRRL 28638]